jgi:hypothetical protein
MGRWSYSRICTLNEELIASETHERCRVDTWCEKRQRSDKKFALHVYLQSVSKPMQEMERNGSILE